MPEATALYLSEYRIEGAPTTGVPGTPDQRQLGLRFDSGIRMEPIVSAQGRKGAGYPLSLDAGTTHRVFNPAKLISGGETVVTDGARNIRVSLTNNTDGLVSSTAYTYAYIHLELDVEEKDHV